MSINSAAIDRWRRLPAANLDSSAELRADWDRLNAQGLGLPFLDAEVVAAAYQCFGTGREQLIVGSAGSDACVMAVLAPQGALRWGTFAPSQIPLAPLVAACGIGPPGPTWALSMLRHSPGLCLSLTIASADTRQWPREPDSADNEHVDYIETAWLEISGDFDTYWAGRSKNLRQNMRKQRNKLATDGVATSLRELRQQDDMAAALERYGKLESSGWKAAQGTAVHPSNAQGRFYRRVFEHAASRNEALVFEYRFGEDTVAMDLCLQRGPLLVILKTAYDEAVPKPLSPAALLREDALRSLHERGEVRRIEYFGRVMDWHTKLTDHRRALYQFTTFRWPWIKSAALRRRAAAAPVNPAMATASPQPSEVDH